MFVNDKISFNLNGNPPPLNDGRFSSSKTQLKKYRPRRKLNFENFRKRPFKFPLCKCKITLLDRVLRAFSLRSEG